MHLRDTNHGMRPDIHQFETYNACAMALLVAFSRGPLGHGQSLASLTNWRGSQL